MQYPEAFRHKVLEQALTGNRSQKALSAEFGIGCSTIQNWLRQHRRLGGASMSSKERSPHAWTRTQRLDALLETHSLDEAGRSAWCRQHGVHSHHLEQWRAELLSSEPVVGSSSNEMRALRQENKTLKQQLRRKDKALAETAALLVLKKKAAQIWGEDEDD